MELEYFINVRKGIKDIMIDVREISHVIVTKGMDGGSCIVSMKNGRDLEVDENLFVKELERLDDNKKDKFKSNE